MFNNNLCYKEIYNKCKEGQAGILAHLIYKRISTFMAWIILKINPSISPNKVTLLQYILLPFTISSLLVFHNPLLFAFLLMMHDWLDGVDGCIARVTKKTSDFGAFLDAVTDKLIFFLVILLLAIYHNSYLLPLIFFTLEAFYHISVRYYEKKILKKVINIDYDGQSYTMKKKIIIGLTNDILYTLLFLIVMLKISIEIWFVILLIGFWIPRIKKILKILCKIGLV